MLGAWAVLSAGPPLVVLMNAFKPEAAIFSSPLAPPLPGAASVEGFKTVFTSGGFGRAALNTLIVALASAGLVAFAAAPAAHALVEWRIRWKSALFALLTLGIMVPIRLSTPGLVELMARLGLVDTLACLVLVYAAQGLAPAIFILTEFLRTVPADVKDAARLDGASEAGVFFRVVAPLTGPALLVVFVFALPPAVNDLWFPLMLAPSEETMTLTLAAQRFMGQFAVDWSATLAALSVSFVPAALLFALAARKLVAEPDKGAVK